MITAFIVTIILVIIFEIVTTAVIPALGVQKYRPAFYMLIIVYLSLRMESPILPILIFVVMWFHSAFTIEGWAFGTCAGIFTSILISSLKDVMHFNTNLVTIVSVQLLLFFWFIIESLLILTKLGEFHYLLERFQNFLPESMVLALFSPILFALLDKLWHDSEEDKMGVDV
ncbi:MAG: hypothetical protein HQK53_01870 [Oligoflexia bacterium]|nr:hypothetical protein [Oligoflexia bacterium]